LILTAVSPKESNFEAFDYEDEAEFLRSELAHLKDLEDLLAEFGDMEDDGIDEEQDAEEWNEETLAELFDLLPEDDVDDEVRDKEENKQASRPMQEDRIQESAAADLENALLQGVVPVSAGVGDDQLPGDYDFDPLNLSTKDYFRDVQSFLLKLIPGEESSSSSEQAVPSEGPRPRALILRDYREAEIRHGRLAMLAAVFWPLQEMLDQLLLEDDLFGPLLYGPVTLPYFPLLMTAIMLLLGYLDIYSQAIKDRDSIGEAFLPADCFWDPLQIMEGGSDRMKRNMQERELLVRRAFLVIPREILGYSRMFLVLFIPVSHKMQLCFLFFFASFSNLVCVSTEWTHGDDCIRRIPVGRRNHTSGTD
jgi:hypothetical protein